MWQSPSAAGEGGGASAAAGTDGERTGEEDAPTPPPRSPRLARAEEASRTDELLTQAVLHSSFVVAVDDKAEDEDEDEDDEEEDSSEDEYDSASSRRL